MRYSLAGPKTAALGLFNGLKLKLPDPKSLPEVQDDWVFVLGGAGSVGQYAVQVRNLLVAVLLPTYDIENAYLARQNLRLQGRSNMFRKDGICM